MSTSGKEWVLTRPRDLPCGGEFALVQWRKRRWRCRTQACPRRSFTEQVGQVSAGMRTTTRLRTALAVAVEDGRDQSEVAAAHGVSWPTVQRAVVARGAAELVEPEPTTVLGMDETRFGRPRWLPDGHHDDGRVRWTIAWHVGDAASLPFPDHAYDVVLCQMGLMFMQDRQAAVTEMRRVAARGGRVVNTPGPVQPAFALVEQALVEHISADLGGFVRAVFSLHDPDDVTALLRDAGLVEMSIDQPMVVASGHS